MTCYYENKQPHADSCTHALLQWAMIHEYGLNMPMLAAVAQVIAQAPCKTDIALIQEPWSMKVFSKHDLGKYMNCILFLRVEPQYD